jgi:hypothetical protein
MALRNPPSWLQNGSHPAENDRLTTTGVIWKSKGIADYGSFRVSQSGTPAMTVSVAAGHAMILGTQTATQGLYIAYNDAATTVAISTASTTLPRIDRLCLTVQDSFYGGTANNQVILQAIAGTPNASPVAPAEPANSLTIALIAVAANTTAITDGNITDARITAQLSENAFTAASTAANTLTVNGIAGQTGKAFKINDSTATQKFAVAVDGTLTFADGSTQSTAAVGGVTSVSGGSGITATGTTSVSVAIDTLITADLTSAQTLTNKILTSPQVNVGINTQSGTSYTTVLADNGKIVTQTNASSITTTIPPLSSVLYPIGAQITFAQFGAGQVTIQGGSGVTIVSTGATSSTPKLRVQYSTATAIQTSNDNWLVVGDIA